MPLVVGTSMTCKAIGAVMSTQSRWRRVECQTVTKELGREDVVVRRMPLAERARAADR